MTSSKIPLAGVIGDPVSHSRSPRLHGQWLRRHEIAGAYVPLHVSTADLQTVVRTLPKMGFVGANVTIPHKIAVLALADDISPQARRIGAANTLIYRGDGSLYADNTDGYGFIANLRQSAPGWRPTAGAAVVLGAGGAARAILVALMDAGVPEIRLSNRTQATAEQLRQEFGDIITVVPWDDAALSLDGAATVVNTTSLGMSGQPELAISLAHLSPAATVTDIVYTPLRTRLLTEAAQRGCTTVDGLGMLLHQAVPGFENWFGLRPEVDDTLREAVLA